MFSIYFFKDQKKAKLMAQFMGILTLAWLLIAALIKIFEMYKLSTYDKVIGTITDKGLPFSGDVYTDISYTIDGKDYTVRFNRMFTNADRNGQLELLCNPAKPNEPEVAAYVGTASKVRFLTVIPIGFFFFIFSLNYLIVRSRKE